MTDAAFVVPTSPMGAWEQLSENEQTWIEFIRVISGGRDPKITTDRVRKLREVLDAGSGVWRASGSPRRRCTHLQTSTQHGFLKHSKAATSRSMKTRPCMVGIGFRWRLLSSPVFFMVIGLRVVLMNPSWAKGGLHS